MLSFFKKLALRMPPCMLYEITEVDILCIVIPKYRSQQIKDIMCTTVCRKTSSFPILYNYYIQGRQLATYWLRYIFVNINGTWNKALTRSNVTNVHRCQTKDPDVKQWILIVVKCMFNSCFSIRVWLYVYNFVCKQFSHWQFIKCNNVNKIYVINNVV